MTFSNYEKERQLIIKSMHSSYFSKHVLAKNVSVLIKDKTLNLIGKTIIRYYSRTDEPITINSISLLLEQRLNLQAKRTHAEIPPQVMDELNKEVSALFDSKEDNSELLLNELQSYVRTQLANEAILEEASKGEDNISERVAKRLDEINDINLSGTKYKPLDVLEDVERKLELYKNFGGERVTSGLPSFDRVTGGGLEKGQIALFGAGSGTGKAQPYSERVMTPKGIVHMGDLKIGDYVYNRFGKPVKVTNIFEKGKLDVYDVVTSDGRHIKVNDDHLFSYYSHSRGKESLVTKPLKDLIKRGINVGDKGCHFYIPKPSAIEYPEANLSYDPYTVGALLGDGSLVGKRIYISGNEDKYPVFQKIVDNNDCLSAFKRNTLKNYTHSFVLKDKQKYNRILAVNEDLNLPQAVIHHSYNKEIPQELMTSSIQQRFALVQGLMDTDGSLKLRKDRNNTTSISFSNTSKKLVLQLQEILRSLGYIATLCVDKRVYSHDTHCYTLTVQCNVKDTYKLFNNPNKLKLLEKANDRKLKKYNSVGIKSVTKLDYQENMRCIMVDDEEHLYVSGDYVVSHNTTALTNLTYYYLMKGHNNVLHISLEELEQDQNLRFDRIMMDASIKEVFDNYGRVKDDYLDMVKRFYSNLSNSEVKNRIFFEKSTPLTLTVDDVKQMIEQVERNNNIKIDVVVLDYADLLKRQGYSDNEAKSGELLFQDLVKMAQQTQTLVITATQLNRGAGLEDVATLANVEGSYRKINTVAFAATLNSNSEERKQGYVRWYIDKVRNGYWKDDDFLYFKYNTKSMRLIEENDSQKAEHKTLAMANNNSQANAGNKKAKIDKKVDLATVINEAIGN